MERENVKKQTDVNVLLQWHDNKSLHVNVQFWVLYDFFFSLFVWLEDYENLLTG